MKTELYHLILLSSNLDRIHLHHASDSLVVGKLSGSYIGASSTTDDANSVSGMLSTSESSWYIFRSLLFVM